MENRVFIGIDPGKSGGVAIIYEDVYKVIKCPDTVADMAYQLMLNLKNTPDNVFISAAIELVHSMPKQGVKSVWTFGQNYGQWLGILATLKIPYKQITPHKWMSHYGSMPKDKKERKNYLKHLAQQRFPDSNITLATADAILIANYLRETNKV